MKSYFLNLFNYDSFANGLILDAIIKAGNPQKTVQLMAHLLAAQQVWLARCLGLPPLEIELWPELEDDSNSFAKQIAVNAGKWTNYLNDLRGEDFETVIHYQNTRGDSFENKQADILAHVINHGTHHRAQIGQLLKYAGVQHLPTTDYIFYLRNLN